MIGPIFILLGTYFVAESLATKKLSLGDYIEDKPIQPGDEVVFQFNEDAWLEIYEDDEYPSMEIQFQSGEPFEVVVFDLDKAHYHVKFEDGSIAFIPTTEVSVIAVNDEVGTSLKKGGFIADKKKSGRKWIQEAIKDKGSLRRTAKREGLIKGEEKLSMADLKKLEKKGGKTAKRAHLAETLKRLKK